MDGLRDTFKRFNVTPAHQAFGNTGGAFNVWMESPSRNTKSGYAMEFGQSHDPDKFNLAQDTVPFMRLSRAPLTQEELVSPEYLEFEELFLGTALEQTCGGDVQAFQYLLNWSASTVQRPGERTGTMVWLTGPQGSGKGWFFSCLRPLFGPAFLVVNSMARITNQFNAPLLGKLVVVCDEAIDESGTHADMLKNIITEPEIFIEGKYALQAYA
jgi:Family of unknown function (DUF5906)